MGIIFQVLVVAIVVIAFLRMAKYLIFNLLLGQATLAEQLEEAKERALAAEKRVQELEQGLNPERADLPLEERVQLLEQELQEVRASLRK